MPTAPALIADIGGTNARFAMSRDSQPWFTDVETLKCDDYASVFDALDSYLKGTNSSDVSTFCLAVAGSVQNQTMTFLNNDWSVSADELNHRYKLSRTHLMNDFEAISYGLSKLTSDDLALIEGPDGSPPTDNYRIAVIGPGSGLGVAGLDMRENHLTPLSTEGGHVSFAPNSPLQQKILRHLQSKYDRVSNERLVSGPGLVNIYHALCDLSGVEIRPLTPADIALAASNKSDEFCIEALQTFFEILGQVAGDTALSLGAYDGLFIAGGISQRYPKQLAQSHFRQAFENKGRYQEMMRGIPTWLIKHKNPGLLGASVYANYYV